MKPDPLEPAAHSRDSAGRRGPLSGKLWMLAAAALLLFVLGTATVCVERVHDFTMDFDNERYGADAWMAVGFNYCDKWNSTCEMYGNTDNRHVFLASVYVEGVEYCLPSLPPWEQDFANIDAMVVGVALAEAPVGDGIGGLHTADEGGYDLVTPGCLLEHQLNWAVDFEWRTHGEERQWGKLQCISLIDLGGLC